MKPEEILEGDDGDTLLLVFPNKIEVYANSMSYSGDCMQDILKQMKKEGFKPLKVKEAKK